MMSLNNFDPYVGLPASAPPPLARKLGYAGLIPFVLLAALLWTVRADVQAWVAIALVAYAASIASFLGAIHWGLAQRLAFLQDDVQNGNNAARIRFHYIWGVTPSLMAWLAAIIPAYAGLPLLGLILSACYLVDRRTYAGAGMAFWLPMRLQLTVVAVLSCLLGAATA